MQGLECDPTRQAEQEGPQQGLKEGSGVILQRYELHIYALLPQAVSSSVCIF